MSGSNAKIEWYLARDGQQHGPLTDAELKKFIELGHLNPSDLVWRAGFPEWRTASEVFPETHADPAAAPGPPEAKTDETARPAEQQRAGPSGDEPASTNTEPRGEQQMAAGSDTTEISRDRIPPPGWKRIVFSWPCRFGFGRTNSGTDDFDIRNTDSVI